MSVDTVPEWAADLPEDLRSLPLVSKYQTREEFVRGAVNANELLGRKGILPPGENATEQEIAAFQESIAPHRELLAKTFFQKPEKPEEYELPLPDDIPEGARLDEALLGEFRTLAHETGLTKETAKGLFDWYVKRQMEASKSSETEYQNYVKESEATLRKELGKNYDKGVDAAKKLLKTYGDAELVEFLDTSRLSSDPRFVRFMVTVAGHFGEDRLRTPDDAVMSGKITREKLQSMMRDPRYHDPSRRDPEFVRMVDQGYRKLFGEG